MDAKAARELRVQKKAEEGLRQKMKERALKECDHALANFAECAKGRTLSVVWACRGQAKEMNQCLHQYTNDDVMEKYKTAYLREKEAQS